MTKRRRIMTARPSSSIDDLRNDIAGLPRDEAIALVRERREAVNLEALAMRDRAKELSRLLLELEGPAEFHASRKPNTGFVIGRR